MSSRNSQTILYQLASQQLHLKQLTADHEYFKILDPSRKMQQKKSTWISPPGEFQT